jgi:hypothetical protein
MFTDFYRAFYYSVLIIAACISVLCFKKADKTFRWLCLLIILTLISELISRYFSIHRKPNGIIYIIFTPIEFFIYAMIYNLFFNDKFWAKVLFISVAGLIALEIINTLFFQHLAAPTNIMNVEGVLLVILSLKFFINISEKPVYENVLYESVFWFNSAVLIYYAFDVLVWGLHTLIYQLKNPPMIIYQILLLFSGFLYVTYSVAILLNLVSINKAITKR